MKSFLGYDRFDLLLKFALENIMLASILFFLVASLSVKACVCVCVFLDSCEVQR